MKKSICLLAILFCFMIAGCSNYKAPDKKEKNIGFKGDNIGIMVDINNNGSFEAWLDGKDMGKYSLDIEDYYSYNYKPNEIKDFPIYFSAEHNANGIHNLKIVYTKNEPLFKTVATGVVNASSGDSIMAFGDSITRGCKSTAGNNYPSQLSKITGRNVLNLGSDGSLLEGMDENSGYLRLQKAVAINPSVFIFEIGTNDLLLYSNPKEFAYYYDLAIRELKVKTNSKILCCSLLYTKDSSISVYLRQFKNPQSLYKRYNDEIKEISDKYGCKYVDLYTPFKSDTNLLSSDGMHPNDKGYLFIANLIAKSGL